MPLQAILQLALVLALVACALPAPESRPEPEAPAHRVHVVIHGWHSGIVVRAADLPPRAWPAQRDFPGFERLEVGWGDRAYYMAPEGSLALGARALLWPTPGVLHVAAFDGPPERHFRRAAVVELDLSAVGFAALVAAVRDSHETVAEAQPLGPGQHAASRFYASRENFHLLRTCNVWTATMLSAAGVPLKPAGALTAGALFEQLRAHGRVLRAPT